MKNPVLNLENFLSNTNEISVFMLNSDELSLLDTPFYLNANQKAQESVLSKSTKKDFYRPQKTRGIKENKEGLCLQCNKWLKLKNSSYWYHMNFKHGINSKGIKYPEPEIRKVNGNLEGFLRHVSSGYFWDTKTT